MTSVLAVVGATASGKSALAIELAQKFNGELVSCDSVQIYKEFSIGSAKPSTEEMDLVPHHLVDILEPSDLCNAGIWRDMAIPIVEDIARRGKLPIIVGGTGLYLKSLYLGMFDQESRDQTYREFLQNQIQNMGLDFLYNELLQKDPNYAQKISANDALRITRALEAMHVTKIKFSELHLHNSKPNWQWYFAQPDISRDEIYQRIEKRINLMFEQGLEEEVRYIVRHYSETVPAIQTIGYRHMLNYINGTWDWQKMSYELNLDTRHFAKRQLSLFRSLLSDQTILKPHEALELNIAKGK